MSAADFEHWNVHWHTSAFGQSTNLDGKISEFVKCPYLFDRICTFAESIAENSFVFDANFISGLVENFVLAIVNQIFFDECL